MARTLTHSPAPVQAKAGLNKAADAGVSVKEFGEAAGEGRPYFSVGSGSTFAYGVLDTGYKYDLETELSNAVNQAKSRFA